MVLWTWEIVMNVTLQLTQCRTLIPTTENTIGKGPLVTHILGEINYII